jgi:hypothetical protein
LGQLERSLHWSCCWYAISTEFCAHFADCFDDFKAESMLSFHFVISPRQLTSKARGRPDGISTILWKNFLAWVLDRGQRRGDLVQSTRIIQYVICRMYDMIYSIALTSHFSQYCPTYPAQIVVPNKISDTTLSYAVKYRSKGRIPGLVYLHWANLVG